MINSLPGLAEALLESVLDHALELDVDGVLGIRIADPANGARVVEERLASDGRVLRMACIRQEANEVAAASRVVRNIPLTPNTARLRPLPLRSPA